MPQRVGRDPVYGLAAGKQMFVGEFISCAVPLEAVHGSNEGAFKRFWAGEAVPAAVPLRGARRVCL